MPLLRIGDRPTARRGSPPKRGVWAGHEDLAKELKVLAEREPKAWGVVVNGVKSPKAQAVARAINRGTASGFQTTDNEGKFEAHTHLAPDEDQVNLPKNRKGEEVPVYEVWARFIPAATSG